MNKTKENNLEAEISAILVNKLYCTREYNVAGIAESSAKIKELVHLKITAMKQEFEKWDELQCQELDKLKIMNENQSKSLQSFMTVCQKHFGGMGYLMLDETLTKLKDSVLAKDKEIELLKKIELPKSTLIKYFRNQNQEQSKEIEELKVKLGFDQPWNVMDVLRQLAKASDTLLSRYNYDGHYHEEIRICVNRANEIRNALLAPSVQVVKEERKEAECSDACNSGCQMLNNCRFKTELNEGREAEQP